MKRNLQFIVFVLAVLCQNMNLAMAQDRSYEGVVSVKPMQLEQRGDFLHIDIDFIMNNVKVKTARGVDFIPQLVAPECTYNLPIVSIKGGNEYMAYERRLAVMSAKEKKVTKEEMIPFNIDIYCLMKRGWKMLNWFYSVMSVVAVNRP